MSANDIPHNYANCFATKEQCSKCHTCLRSIAAHTERETLEPLTCIHPLYINKVSGGMQCEYYRENRTLRVAYGFVDMFDNVPEKLAQAARLRIQRMYTSRTSYFRTRRGERPIPPDEQESIARIFRKLGIEGEPKYDRYENIYNW